MTNNLPIVSEDISISELIRILDKNEFQHAIINDSNQKYKNTISIYELRRLLLSGEASNSPLVGIIDYSKLYLNTNELNDKEYIQKFVYDLALEQRKYVPILNENCQICDVLSINDLETEQQNFASKQIKDNKNILIVGGAGYLGSILTRLLLNRGYNVRIFDSFIYNQNSLNELSVNSNLNIIKGDFRNIDSIFTALQNIDAVILLAAVVGDPASKLRPVQTIETNLLASQALATACKNQQINRFLYASTCSVYGMSDNILSENSPLNPVSLYARTKISSEEIILKLGDNNFQPTILRMSTLHGYSQRMRFDLVVNTMTLKSYLEKKIQVFGGNQWRPLLHVKDAARAFLLCLENPFDIVGNQVFNVGSETENFRIIDIAAKIKDRLSKDEIQIENLSGLIDNRNYRVTFNKIESKLKYSNQFQIEDSASEIYEKLQMNTIKNPLAKVYYNHYFDSSEEI